MKAGLFHLPFLANSHRVLPPPAPPDPGGELFTSLLDAMSLRFFFPTGLFYPGQDRPFWFKSFAGLGLFTHFRNREEKKHHLLFRGALSYV